MPPAGCDSVANTPPSARLAHAVMLKYEKCIKKIKTQKYCIIKLLFSSHSLALKQEPITDVSPL